MADDQEVKFVDKAGIQAGVKLRTGRPVVLVIDGMKGKPASWLGEAEPDGADAGADAAAGGAKNTHVLALTLKGLGGTPFANERVQVIDPDTGEPVGDPVMTNDQGELRAPVPAQKKYQVRALGDDPLEGEAPQPAVTGDDHLHIDALFLDDGGEPLANEPVTVTHADGKSDGSTDESGWFHLSADAGLFVLEVRQQKFHAFPAPSDAATGGYRFVVPAGA